MSPFSLRYGDHVFLSNSRKVMLIMNSVILILLEKKVPISLTDSESISTIPSDFCIYLRPGHDEKLFGRGTKNRKSGVLKVLFSILMSPVCSLNWVTFALYVNLCTKNTIDVISDNIRHIFDSLNHFLLMRIS